MLDSPTIYEVGRKDRGKRLDRFLQERIGRISRARVQAAIRRRVSLSWGAAPKPATRVIDGGRVMIGFEPIAEITADIRVPVLARGEGWIALDKPAGIPVHPVRTVRVNSLIAAVRRQEDDRGLRLVHRLDRETSGVLLLASDRETARALSMAFEHGRVSKEYTAVVHGEVDPAEGVIDRPIGPHPTSRVFVRQTVDHGRPAVTRWRVDRCVRGATLLRLFPATGRRHQIRVHLEAIGHPIVGDILYGRSDRDYLDLAAGGPDPRLAGGEPRRHMLHSARLRVPFRGRHLEVSSDDPPEFRRWLDARPAVTDGRRSPRP